MISLSENRIALMNLPSTIVAMEELETLINFYSVDKPGPAYVRFMHVDGPGEISAQIDRKFILDALVAQHQKIVQYLKTLGIGE